MFLHKPGLEHDCAADMEKCSDGLQCIYATQMCDGKSEDCKDGSDEDETRCRGMF